MPVRLLLSLLALLALCLAPASPAGASTTQESVFEDDHELLEKGPAERNRALEDMDRLGADVIRSLALWNRIAPGFKKKKKPRRFDGADPGAYPAANWDPYDDLVRGASARGIGLLFSPSGPIPAWASQCGGSLKNRRVCKPNPKEFGKFVQALGTRYSGTYADENQGGGVLPRVDRWSIWNEPNQPGWLMPQYESRRGRRVATAAHRYRSLARSAIAGLRRSGHGAEQILLGETAPIGRTSGSLARRPIPPVEFIRELFCLKSNGRKMTGTAARLASCRRPGKFAVSGFAHHPYTRGGSQPPRAKVLPGEITVSTASRLKKLLQQGARARRVPGGIGIHYTEFGYQTNPPDRLFGVTENEQARYINEADWIAYNDSRIKAVAQYKLVDEPNVSSFQTGLRFLDGTPKAAYDAYRLPLWVRKRSGGLRIYGQVRPADDGARELVDLQHRVNDEANFTTIQAVEVTSLKGHFVVDVPARAGQWRLRWAPARGGSALFSREAVASKK